MNVLIGCEESGVVRDEFLKRGHNAWSCDLYPSSSKLGPRVRHYQCDLLSILSNGWDLLIAHPPCTYLTVAGNRWDNDLVNHPNRKQHRADAIKFVLSLWNAPIPKICLENPVGRLSSMWRQPDQIIHPYDYGHGSAKNTCLWLKNLPPLQKPTTIKVHDFNPPDEIHKAFNTISNKKELAKFRSKTYYGIALAMAEQWG